MKKILLLSVVTSTLVMAASTVNGPSCSTSEVLRALSMPAHGIGDEKGWNFSGHAVAYTQTVDNHGTKDLFGGDTTYGAVGIQLRALNRDIFKGIGVGAEVSSIGQSSRFSDIPRGFSARGVLVPAGQSVHNNSFAFPFFRGGDAQVESGAITQAYITYSISNTDIKVGRQTLPMSLSPFAFSEGWQMFKNTMETALIVNTDVPDTKIVYAAITRANSSIGRLDNFENIAQGGPLQLITVQNKSLDGLTITGSYYYAPEMDSSDNNNWGGGENRDMNIFWADAGYKASNFFIGLQGGHISAEGVDSTTAFGIKAATKLGIVKLSAAYSSVNEGAIRISNLATIQNPMPNMGIKSPLYTQMVLNNIGYHQALNTNWLKLAGTAKVLGGSLTFAYGMAMDNNNPDVGRAPRAFGPNPYEADLIYKTNITKEISLFAAYVLTNRDRQTVDEGSNNFLRFWARYNF